MHLLDTTKDDHKGQPISDASELLQKIKESGSSLTYLEGNSKLMEDFISLLDPPSDKPHKFLYVGDQYLSDILFCSLKPNLDALAVIEEMSMREEEFKAIEEKGGLPGKPLPKLDPRLTQYSEHFGDYFMHTPENQKKNYFVDKVC